MKGVGEMWVHGGRNIRMEDAVQNPEAETQLCVYGKKKQRGKVQGSRRGDVFSQGQQG